MVVQHLERTRDAFVAATQPLTDAQFRFTPAADGWSIGQIVEHVALAELRILDVIDKLPQAPAPSADKTRGAARFARLEGGLPSRQQRRIVAPESLVPKGTWDSPATSLAAFVDARGRTIAAAAAIEADALEHVLPHRFFGEFDLEEWAYFMALHSARHTAQVEEIKAAPGFPPA
ncbi:MAG: DinB family protein [Vicinamibacteraceae bacterium]